MEGQCEPQTAADPEGQPEMARELPSSRLGPEHSPRDLALPPSPTGTLTGTHIETKVFLNLIIGLIFLDLILQGVLSPRLLQTHLIYFCLFSAATRRPQDLTAPPASGLCAMMGPGGRGGRDEGHGCLSTGLACRETLGFSGSPCLRP